MAADTERARRFTGMLYELHRPMADELLRRVDMKGIARMIDVGGGSGVVSLTFTRRYPALQATVVDLTTVCGAGRALAVESGLVDRVTYHAADFLHEDLPGGFDLALMCDVGVYGAEVFARIGAALNRAGRLVVVDALAPADGVAPAGRVIWALERSLADPRYIPPTAEYVRGLLVAAGFRVRSCEDLRLSDDSDPFTIIDAERV
jgi:demethylspheroidene O-methyltransferase